MSNSPLKWLGGKRHSLPVLLEHLPVGERLFEPFVGSAAVALATDYPAYYLGDVNNDLIAMYRYVEQDVDRFIEEARLLFESLNPEDPEGYYKLRERFNKTTCPEERAVQLLALNRFGYNGLCRYNLDGGYNVPHGRYRKVYFPEKELREAAAHFSGRTVFDTRSFEEQLTNVKGGDVVYCDPPYVPLSKTANFTEYSSSKFGEAQHKQLASIAEALRLRGIPVLISNADFPIAREIYSGATQVVEIVVPRSVSAKVESRKPTGELLFIY